MSGERTAYLLSVVEEAVERARETIAMVTERYTPPPPDTDDAPLTMEEVIQHEQEYGHLAPTPGCTHPTCIRAALMLAAQGLA